MNTQPEAVEKLYTVINKLNIDVVELADSAGLGSFIPDNLRQWRRNDFWYESNVRSFLEKAIEHDDKELEMFLEELNRRIRKYDCCRRFESGKCDLPRRSYWDDSVCQKCEKFLDNGVKSLFLRALKLLGYSIDEDGFIIPIQPLDVEREITKILREAAKVDVSVAEKLLPEDIIKKAKEMAEVYVLIYCIENSLRMFIKYVCTHQYGDNYIDKIQISKELREKLEGDK